ncbi:MAG: hypothetical protein AAF916_11220 [Planctomycetota bacterium]
MIVAATANSGAASGGVWVTVGEYANGHEADLAVALLAGHGISARLENREFVGMDWGVAAAVGWIKVNVPEANADAARETLGKMQSAGDGTDLKLGSAAITDAEACLRCGGKMPVEDAVCGACGWSYVSERSAMLKSDSPGPRSDLQRPRKSWWKTALFILSIGLLGCYGG